jgi:hypothetical protein
MECVVPPLCRADLIARRLTIHELDWHLPLRRIDAGEGWQLKAVTTAEIPGFGSKREEIIFILERP